MYFFWLAAVIFALDRVTKIIFTKKLFPDESLIVIDKIFSLTLVRNTGTAFGLLSGANKIFIWISILAITAIIFFLFRLKEKDYFVKLALSLIMGGAAGNLFDRLAFGYVIDFLDFHIWPVFNLADSAITIGCFLLIFRMLIPFSKKRSS